MQEGIQKHELDEGALFSGLQTGHPVHLPSLRIRLQEEIRDEETYLFVSRVYSTVKHRYSHRLEMKGSDYVPLMLLY